MSVYKPKGSPFYHFDFQRRGARFCGSTGCTSRREAEAFERAERDRADARLKAAKAAQGSLQLRHVTARYWDEVGQHSSYAGTVWADLSRLVDYFGADTLLTEITDNDVAKAVAWRRGHQVVRSKEPLVLSPVSHATVNRTITEPLRRLCARARKAWGVHFEREPNWSAHMLAEPQERVRELQAGESAAFTAATREDYKPFFAFARASGLRLRECFLRWSEVDWDAGQITKPGKGQRRVTTPITAAVRAILWPLRGQHPEWVFTYVAKRTTATYVKGTRYPLTYSGVKTTWRRLRKRAGVAGFRFHDFRHDVGTKLLRETGNLKLVQRALNHADIQSTLRYAHVLDSEVADALDTLAKKRRA